MKNRLRNATLYTLLVVVMIAVGTAILNRPDPANAPRTIRYSDFVEAVEANEVSRVLFAPDRGTAQVVENSGERAVVNLAPDKDLLKLLTDHNVDINVQPSREPAAWQKAVGSLIFPLLLLGGLFFLLRRAQGGGVNPSMNFGKSKARVQSADLDSADQTEWAPSLPSFSGWLATLLGIYLVATGVFNIAKVLEGGSTATQQSPEILRQSGIDSSAIPTAIVLSYVVGAPIFLGSGLIALGSIARSVKRNKG